MKSILCSLGFHSYRHVPSKPGYCGALWCPRCDNRTLGLPIPPPPPRLKIIFPISGRIHFSAVHFEVASEECKIAGIQKATMVDELTGMRLRFYMNGDAKDYIRKTFGLEPVEV